MGLLDKLIDRLPWVKERAKLERELEELERRVFALPIDVARAEAQRLLADALEYCCVEVPLDDVIRRIVQSFGPSLREFFTRYESVEEVHGDTRLSRQLIGPATNDPSFTRVGEDMEFSEITAAPGTDEVLLHWGEAPGDEPPARYPSIYHFLLAHAAIQDRYSPP